MPTVLLPAAFGQESGEFTRFHELYENEQYKEALQFLRGSFKEKKSLHYVDYYNLGNVYFKLEQYPQALAAFEIANSINPRDLDVSHNLAQARDAVRSNVGANQLDPGSSLLQKFADRVPASEAYGVSALILLMLSVFWLKKYRRTRNLRKTFGGVASWVGLFALFLSALLCVGKQLSLAKPPAIAISAEIIRSGPSARFVELAKLAPGMKVRILDQPPDSEWVMIQFGASASGWVPDKSVVVLCCTHGQNENLMLPVNL